MTRKECYEQIVANLSAGGIEDAASDASLLMEYIAEVNKNELYVHPETEVDQDACKRLKAAVSDRLKHIPLQHITGVQEFMGLEFTVNEDVLIPRFDTETLVEEVLKLGLSGVRILDVCTGSGCILLSLLHYMHECEGKGIDISDKALSVARSNAAKLGIEADFACGDLFDALKSRENTSNKLKYDLIVSNPPYIRTDVIPTLASEVKDHEPYIALDGSADGLCFYKKIADEAPAFLHKGGMLYFEIGFDQAKAVSAILSDKGYKDIEVYKDLSGNDRVIRGEWR
ncbi:MAG: peptide chain release factor N(5)-glutamine methyltransferase [Lachnospiraceae bacterium]|nr:peptide chain release factor N(5)-glutamine methyltransferase [Lachnospiraceae bacterium]